jgi:hypothetical protein
MTSRRSNGQGRLTLPGSLRCLIRLLPDVLFEKWVSGAPHPPSCPLIPMVNIAACLLDLINSLS